MARFKKVLLTVEIIMRVEDEVTDNDIGEVVDYLQYDLFHQDDKVEIVRYDTLDYEIMNYS